MSVDVKTPTKTQFEHAEFPCGAKKRVPTVTVTGSGGPPPGAAPPPRPGFQRQTSEYLGNKYSRRRRFSERAGGADGGNRERYVGAPGFNNKRNRFFRGNGRGGGGNFSGQERIVLPTRFLLGGNINDPLNLNSMKDEAVNKALNESTPKSSPLAVPMHRQEVHVIIPPNIEDPLGLNSTDDNALLSPNSRSLYKKKRKNRTHKKRNQGDRSDINDSLDVTGNSTFNDSKDFTKPMHVDIASDSETIKQDSSEAATPKPDPPLTPSGQVASQTDNCPGIGGHSKRNDEIVSPAIPQDLPQLLSPKSRRRKRTSSECKSDSSGGLMRISVDSDKSVKSDKTSPHRTKYLKRQYSHSSTQSQATTPPPGKKPKIFHKDRKPPKQFIYGNYNRYYGYRNPCGSEKDDRLTNFDRAWFEGKEVLDIGCNVGHITLSIAKDLGPKRVVGMDIDTSLISAAKRNIRHYLTTKVTSTQKFPSSLIASFGPIAAPPVKEADDPVIFPNNVMFCTGNYVLESDELVDMTREEYDVILALSVTKWMHLNWGDAGLKRTFRRMYKQLRPGGKLILEPQLWPSYKKRKKLTDIHFQNYSQIQLRPEQFREYLLREIGFSKCEALEVPFNKAKGFQRPLQVFTKSSTTQPGSRITTPGTCSRGATPRFHIGWSGTTTPTTCDSPSNPATPGYSTTDSPKCPDLTKDPTAKTETLLTLEAVQEEESMDSVRDDAGKTGVRKEAQSDKVTLGRPLNELRTLSAPALLETVGYKGKPSSASPVREEPVPSAHSPNIVPETRESAGDEQMVVEGSEGSQTATKGIDNASAIIATSDSTSDVSTPVCYISSGNTGGEQKLSPHKPVQSSEKAEASLQLLKERLPDTEAPTKIEHEHSQEPTAKP